MLFSLTATGVCCKCQQFERNLIYEHLHVYKQQQQKTLKVSVVQIRFFCISSANLSREAAGCDVTCCQQ